MNTPSISENAKHLVALVGTLSLLLGTGFQIERFAATAKASEMGQRLIGPDSTALQFRLLFLGERSKQAKALLAEIDDQARRSVPDPTDGDPGTFALAKHHAAKAALVTALKDLQDVRSWLLLGMGSAALFFVAVWDVV